MNSKESIESILSLIQMHEDEKTGLYAIFGKKEATERLYKALTEAVADLKPDTHLLGCNKHWSDDSGGTCTCDENERTANRFYEKAKDDMRAKLDKLFGKESE